MWTQYYDSDPTSPVDVLELCLEHGPIEVLEITTDPGEGYKEMCEALVERGLRFIVICTCEPCFKIEHPLDLVAGDGCYPLGVLSAAFNRLPVLN